ncbi:putative hydrolase of the HAD superfamily [Salsuginibacillus halophilus]|uniref:Putative hydrolase of the HAD superfamily n=1 Tax=Salsuginibacillus halophilus TaxID=517424 RepID=A0A2P8H7Z9_9BACI|nr:HAD family hydrolase [Salsuginibacillus halophilus]PSL42321.1 putative hydrolase of the HAD superfamily [Salsuginibacillus halophilus]
MKQWSVICFDLDNTLHCHETAFRRAISHLFNEKKQFDPVFQKRMEISANDWYETFKHYSDALWPAYEDGELSTTEYRRARYGKTLETHELDWTDEEADAFQNAYEEVIPSFSTAYEGMKELLKQLQRENMKLGIITNGRTETQWEKIKCLQLADYIPEAHMFISEEVGVKKPAPGIFNTALQKLNAHPSEALFIGDSWELDVAGAMDAGWEAVFLNTRSEKPNTNHTPFAICDSLQEVYRTVVKPEEG